MAISRNSKTASLLVGLLLAGCGSEAMAAEDMGAVDFGPAADVGRLDLDAGNDDLGSDLGTDSGPTGCAVDPDGTACDDGNARTFDDQCTGGVCQGTACQCTEGACCSDGCQFDGSEAVCVEAGNVAQVTCTGAPLACGQASIVNVIGERRCDANGSALCTGSISATSNDSSACPATTTCVEGVWPNGDAACVNIAMECD